jgi:organic radical activating enzyme
LSLISTVAHQVERELWQDDLRRLPTGNVASRIVRVNFRCNQACDFCFVSTHLPDAPDEAVREAILGITREGGALVLSGGEPTLNPRLAEYVRFGRETGAQVIELQTNATRLSDPERVRELVDAGLDEAFVSLHGATADTSDRITGAPGTFVKTVAGIDELVRQKLVVRLNYVLCRSNHHEFPAYVDMVARRWPAAAVTVSFVAPSTDLVPRTPDLVPRYSDILPDLAEGIRRARTLGVTLSGFDSMCGIPLCLVPDDVTDYFDYPEIPDGFDRGELVRAEACTRCDLRRRCFGVRRGYVELHGTAELRAMTRPTG